MSESDSDVEEEADETLADLLDGIADAIENGPKRTTFPLTISGVRPVGEPYSPNYYGEDAVGKLVMIRPVYSIDPEQKTRLGIYIGSISMSLEFSQDPETEQLVIHRSMMNPAILVPALKRVVFGYQSWWSFIESEEDLRQITDEDIDNVWYVKALKEAFEDLDKESE